MNNRRNNAIFQPGHYWHCCVSVCGIKSWLIVKETLEGFKSAPSLWTLGWAVDHADLTQPTRVGVTGKESTIQFDCY